MKHDVFTPDSGITKLIMVGFIANSCVEATARFGMELGYHVTLITDATAAFDAEGMTAARVNAKLFAHAELTTDELLAALPASTRIPAKEQTSGQLVTAQ